MTQIRLADNSFDPEQFLAGAPSAFEMILDAFTRVNSKRSGRFSTTMSTAAFPLP